VFVEGQNISSNAILAAKELLAVLTPTTLSYLEEDIDHETYYSCHPAFANGLINGM
jgi:hypothetical protein